MKWYFANDEDIRFNWKALNRYCLKKYQIWSLTVIAKYQPSIILLISAWFQWNFRLVFGRVFSVFILFITFRFGFFPCGKLSTVANNNISMLHELLLRTAQEITWKILTIVEINICLINYVGKSIVFSTQTKQFWTSFFWAILSLCNWFHNKLRQKL